MLSAAACILCILVPFSKFLDPLSSLCLRLVIKSWGPRLQQGISVQSWTPSQALKTCRRFVYVETSVVDPGRPRGPCPPPRLVKIGKKRWPPNAASYISCFFTPPLRSFWIRYWTFTSTHLPNIHCATNQTTCHFSSSVLQASSMSDCQNVLTRARIPKTAQ